MMHLPMPLVPDMTLTRDIIDRLDQWVNDLAAPLLPARGVEEPNGELRLLLREHTPHAVMLGKLVRAASGIKAALVLADAGYVSECGAILRIVSDFCIEIIAVADSLRRGDPPAAIRAFVEQYFVPLARTSEDYAAIERPRYVSREELIKAEVRMSEDAGLEGERSRMLRRFLNMRLDAYVHGAYETSMELFNPNTGRFMVAGHESLAKHAVLAHALTLKLHEVIVAVLLTAAQFGNADVQAQAREALDALDAPAGTGG